MDFRKEAIQQREAMTADLQGCLRIPSVYASDDSGRPYGRAAGECLDYMLEKAAAMGFSVVNMDDQLGWCECGEGPEMAAVLCHLDVVPAGDGWTVPPFEGVVRDGRIYGRGAMDDKGPAIAALYAMKLLRDSGAPMTRRLRLIFGLNEETGSADMKYYTAHGGEIPVMGITPDGEYPVINGEKGLITQFFTTRPLQEGPLRLVSLTAGTAHNIVPDKAAASIEAPPALAREIADKAGGKIHCRLTENGVIVEAEGIGAHGGTPWEGENAAGRLLIFLNTLPFEGGIAAVIRFLADKVGMEYDGASLGIAMADAASGALTVNMGVVTFEDGLLTVKLNYRYPVTAGFDDCGPSVTAQFREAGFRESFQQHKASLFMPEDSPLVSSLLEVYSEYTGENAEPKCIGGGTYAKMIPNTVAFGPIFPGDDVREHKPDEYIELERLTDNAAILASAMYRMTC